MPCLATTWQPPACLEAPVRAWAQRRAPMRGAGLRSHSTSSKDPHACRGICSTPMPDCIAAGLAPYLHAHHQHMHGVGQRSQRPGSHFYGLAGANFYNDARLCYRKTRSVPASLCTACAHEWQRDVHLRLPRSGRGMPAVAMALKRPPLGSSLPCCMHPSPTQRHSHQVVLQQSTELSSRAGCAQALWAATGAWAQC